MPNRIIIYERIATWVRQVRPRCSAWDLQCVETRLPTEAARAARGYSCPITLVDLGKDPERGLETVAQVHQAASHGLVLMLDPLAHVGFDLVGRELGANLVISGRTIPPTVVKILDRWVDLSRKREAMDGWSLSREVEVDPWDRELGFPLGLPLRYTEGST